MQNLNSRTGWIYHLLMLWQLLPLMLMPFQHSCHHWPFGHSYHLHQLKMIHRFRSCTLTSLHHHGSSTTSWERTTTSWERTTTHCVELLVAWWRWTSKTLTLHCHCGRHVTLNGITSTTDCPVSWTKHCNTVFYCACTTTTETWWRTWKLLVWWSHASSTLEVAIHWEATVHVATILNHPTITVSCLRIGEACGTNTHGIHCIPWHTFWAIITKNLHITSMIFVEVSSSCC